MRNGGISLNEGELEYLNNELQQQRGMLWLLGEIMKASVNITSFKGLMSELTDMLMGVTGVSNCYLWYKNDLNSTLNYTCFLRSTKLENEFKVKEKTALPAILQDLKDTHVFSTEEITETLVAEVDIPSSRVAIPLWRSEHDEPPGMLVIEHDERDFFSTNKITFFETLAIFISCKLDNSKLFERVKEKSIKDPLTQIYNRGYLKSALDTMYNKYKYVTVAVCDTDNFKSINDELGHLEGDAVLKAIAQLANGIGKDNNGKVIRYGGDEFVILIPKPLDEALVIFEEFRKCVHYLKIAYDLAKEVSVTIGVCTYPEMIGDYQQLINVADRALLRGKEKGKNRVVLANEVDMVFD